MGKLVTDPQFLTRLEVINYLQHDDQVDPQLWLQRLSRDPVPAVRAAAARVGVDPEWNIGGEFLARVQEMSESDPTARCGRSPPVLFTRIRSGALRRNSRRRCNDALIV